MSDDYEPEFHSYCNEDLENSELIFSNGKIIGRTKPTIVTVHMCKLFCTGSECKYCKPELKFSGDDMVIEGLYSSWVTSNILAMARPSTANINQFAIIEKFLSLNMKTIINMQKAGEHNYCGYPLEASGFSYDPDLFMKSGIDCLNYPCEDFGVLHVQYLLDISKIMQHQLTRGKIAVHCHAGLGRTGLVIACYLIFNNRIAGIDAINYVRNKRRNSIQTTMQVDKIIEFAAYLRPLRCVMWTPVCGLHRFSLQEAVLRQKKLVHGKEAYIVSCIPKIIYICLRKISLVAQEFDAAECDLFDGQDSASADSSDDSVTTRSHGHQADTRSWLRFQRWNKKIKHYFNKSFSEDNASSILYCFTNTYRKHAELESIKNELNTTDEAWRRLYQMDDIHLHCQLVTDYLDSLKFPVLRSLDMKALGTDYDDDPFQLLLRLETCVGRTLAVLLGFINQCKGLDGPRLWQLRSVIFSRLTHKNVTFYTDPVGSEPLDLYQFDLNDSLTDTLRSFLGQV